MLACLLFSYFARNKERECKIIDPVRPWWCDMYVAMWQHKDSFVRKRKKSKMATQLGALAETSRRLFPIRTLISTNKNALKSTTDGSILVFSQFQQLIDRQNARKTQLRFCLFRPNEREIFSFPLFVSWTGKMVSHTQSRDDLACLIGALPFCSRTHFFPDSCSLSCSALDVAHDSTEVVTKAPYDSRIHAQCCLLAMTWFSEKTANGRPHWQPNSHIGAIFERRAENASKRFSLKIQKEEKILKKMFLVGRSRSNFYTFGGKMQNFLVARCGKIVKSDWKCIESDQQSAGREKSRGKEIFQEHFEKCDSVHEGFMWPIKRRSSVQFTNLKRVRRIFPMKNNFRSKQAPKVEKVGAKRFSWKKLPYFRNTSRTHNSQGRNVYKHNTHRPLYLLRKIFISFLIFCLLSL